MATIEDRLARLEGAVFGPAPATGGDAVDPYSRQPAGLVPDGTPLGWSEQAGDDSGARVGQGDMSFPFTPPITGKYELNVSARDPRGEAIDVVIDGPGVNRPDEGGYRGLNGDIDAFSPMLQAGQGYTVRVRPLDPYPRGAYAVRFVPGVVQRG